MACVWFGINQTRQTVYHEKFSLHRANIFKGLWLLQELYIVVLKREQNQLGKVLY